MNESFPFGVFHDCTEIRRKANSQPSSALLRGLNRVAKVPTESNSLGTGTTTHHSHYESHGARTVLKPTVAQWPSSDDQEPLRNSSSASFLDDVRRMVNASCTSSG